MTKGAVIDVPGDRRMAKYDALERYLSRRGSVEIELAFEEVERIIGSKLPETA